MGAPTIGTQTEDKFGYPKYDDATKTLSFVDKDVDIVVNDPGGTKLVYAIGDEEITTEGKELTVIEGKATISLKDKAFGSKTTVKVMGYDGENAGKVLTFTAERVTAPINAAVGNLTAEQYGYPKKYDSGLVEYLNSDITLPFSVPDGVTKVLYTIDGADPIQYGRPLEVTNGTASLTLAGTAVEQVTTVKVVPVEGDIIGQTLQLVCKRVKTPTAPATAPHLVGYFSGDAPTTQITANLSTINFYGQAAMQFTYTDQLYYGVFDKSQVETIGGVEHFVTALQPAELTNINGLQCLVVTDDIFLRDEYADPVTEMILIVAQANEVGKGPLLQIPMRIKSPDAPDVRPASGYIEDRGNITFINNSLRISITPANNDYAGTSFIEYQMAEANGNTWPTEPTSPDNWTRVSFSGNEAVTIGNNEQPFCTGRFFVRAGRPAGEGSSLMVFSEPTYIDITRMNADAISLADKTGWTEGKLVQNADDWKITGFYHTNAPGTPDYIYVTDANGNVIKIVGKDITKTHAAYANIMEGSSASHTWLIPAGGMTGRIHFAEGNNLTEIHITNTAGTESFISFLAQAPVQNDGFPVAPQPENRTTIDGATDFNRYVELRSLTWLGANNEMEMTDGTRLPIYTRLQGTAFSADQLNSLEKGKLYRVKGFIGIADGNLSIFPIAKIDQCPGTPRLFAPNPVGEPEEGKDYVAVNAISPIVEFTVKGNAHGESTFKYSLNDGPLNDVENGKIPVSLTDGSITRLSVYAVLGDMTSLVPAKVEITKVAATAVSSIKDFKEDVFADFEATKNTVYQLTDGKVLVEKITPYYLYVRDYTDDQNIAMGDEGYMHRLLIRNDNHWNADIAAGDEERPIEVGDLLTGFALSAEDFNGNIVSNSTGYARTFRFAGQDKDNALIAEERTVNSTFTLTNEDRMRLLTLKGVTVSKSGNAPDITYTLEFEAGQQVRMRIGDIFEFRGGWAEAYEAGTPFNLTGVVLIDGKDTGKFSFALLDFSGTEKLSAPAVHLKGATDGIDDIEQPFNTGSIVMSLPTDLPEEAKEGAKIFYTTDGTDPLNNIASRKEYTGEIALGDTDMEIRAFVAAPGYTPSNVVLRRFIRSSRDVQFILNFLQTAQEGQTYRFTGDTKIVAVGGDYIFVAGRVGHYLPIRRTGGWDGIAGIEPEKYLSGFTVGFDIDESGNRVAVADGFESTFAPAETCDREISYVPDEATKLNSDTHPRRLVHLRNVKVCAPAEAAALADGNIAWTITESADGGTHALIPGKLGEVKITERDSEGNETVSNEFVDGKSYDITGFVMLNEAREAAMEMWPLEATALQTTAAVKASFSTGTIADPADEDGTIPVRFEGMTMVTLTCDTHNATIYYALGKGSDNLKWYEYQRPFAVTADEYIHAKAVATGCIESGHTHIALTALAQSGDIAFTPVAADGETTLTIAAKGEVAEGTVIWYSTGTDRSCNTVYSAPLTFTEETLVHACLQEPGKSKGAVYSIQVMVMDYPEVPEVPEDIEAKGNSLRFSQNITEEGWVVVTIEPVTPVEGGTIYYTTEAGKKLPGEGIRYEAPVVMKESGVIIAVMTIEGKPASQAYETTVWVVPVTTGIDGIEGEGESAVRVDGSDIIAPEGSEVYDLTGRRVNPTGLAGGVYIVRTPGGKAVKVRV
ncbi:MAG: chitobiase/beta-hexosaminidase C-terminal domain-containing protein [Paramuribaculum sp.]|nr:chitobiase/beta-hexosaminidase C-terminal domain-containing protein [Paramuribaculum sp.]